MKIGLEVLSAHKYAILAKIPEKTETVTPVDLITLHFYFKKV